MRINRDRLIAFLMILPSLVAIAVFVYGFIGWTARSSVSAWEGLLPDYTFTGLTNFIDLFNTPRFQIDIRNTAIFTVLFISTCLILGLVLAVLLDQRIRGEALFRNIYLFPMAISFIVTGVVWRWLLNPATSLERLSGLNLLFHQAGLDFLISKWYTHPSFGIVAIVIPATWQMSGFTMALYLAGIRSIPEELREAARVDGANELVIYRHIVMPMLKAITLSAVIILGHTSLKIFDLVMAITQEGGQGYSADVPALNMWYTTFRALRFGEGAAIAIVILLTVAVLIVPYLVYTFRSEVEA
ncbi:MAG: sugar ABC transporter permease [Anaerolineaceae bacterium]|nr:MAG: sugar ABC transporter permease [Anaerolineaceae bacterium]